MNTTRRRFLSIGTGVFLAGGSGLRESGFAGSQLGKYQRQARALGSQVRLTVLHADADTANDALTRGFEELELIESLLSIYRRESQVCQLNRDGELARPHAYLLDVLTYAQRISEASDGAFDVTVQPLWNVFQEAQRRGAIPSDEAIDAARARVDWRRVRISPGCVQLAGTGTAITLNGIAQGFAADRVASALKASGIEHALVDCGELSAFGKNKADSPWPVGIQHPREKDAYLAVAALTGRCLATSGDYATSFSEDLRAHHLFDSRTGRSPVELCSVSIVATTSMEADALSTAVIIAGVDKGGKLIENRPGADALFVLKNGRTLATKGFPWKA